jgi:hypothetical protein
MALKGDPGMDKASPASDPLNFSLVLGGPVFQIFRRAHLSGDDLELLTRRVIFITLLAWLPLLLLSMLDGHAFAGPIRIPFLLDVEVHARYLVALPALIIAEITVHRRVSPLVRRFVDSGIVLTEDLPVFQKAVRSASRVRNSVAVELALLLLVYTAGLWLWRSQIVLGTESWYLLPDRTGLHLTRAGYWYAYVSIPMLQFFFLRWYMRLGLWFWLLWRTSKLNLRLTAAHPDRAGGLGFLGRGSYAFGPVLFAQGALLSGVIASRVLYEGQKLVSFKIEAVGLIVFMVLFILGPLFMFTPMMDRTQRKGAAEFGVLANRYVFGFEEKWIQGRASETGKLLGTTDIQSLADLGNSYKIVSEMRLVPFGLVDVTRLAAATAAPLIPLTLTIFSVEELITRLVKILF